MVSAQYCPNTIIGQNWPNKLCKINITYGGHQRGFDLTPNVEKQNKFVIFNKQLKYIKIKRFRWQYV